MNRIRRAWANIDLQALQHNLSLVRQRCPNSRLIPVIKANAYGHGIEQVALALAASGQPIEAFAVAAIDEAQQLKELALNIPIILLPGFINDEELQFCLRQNIEPVIHSQYQLKVLCQQLDGQPSTTPFRVWLKQNTGMNRLGLNAQDFLKVFSRLQSYPQIEVVLMSHLACPDMLNDDRALELTEKQIKLFESSRSQLADSSTKAIKSSLAASAAILLLPQSHYDYVRPGIMMYGASPSGSLKAEEIGLQPVMTLHSRVIAINKVACGESIGYGSTYTCERDLRIGLVSIGYGDGYPRAAGTGTPVGLKHSNGIIPSTLLGRVSMDMLTIDLTDIDQAGVGDEVILWGEGISADEVAACAGTISYELFCNVTRRVPFTYTVVNWTNS